MKLVEVVMSGDRIRDTLVAIGVSPGRRPLLLQNSTGSLELMSLSKRIHTGQTTTHLT